MARSQLLMYRKKPSTPSKVTNTSIPIRRGPNDEVIPRSEIQKDLKIYEELGSGSFGKVYRAFDPLLNQVVAVKMIEMDTSGDVDEVLLELKFLSELKCEQITKYFYSTLHNSVLFVMMEYCAGGSCMHLLKQYNSLTENSAAYIMYESLKGLEYIHSQNKIHRDLKSANILVTHNYGIKIADFGVSAQLSCTMPERNSFMGTPYWMAPEVIESETTYNTGVDIWSMGIVMFELLTGNPPHRRINPTEAMLKIVKEPPPQLCGKWISREVSELVAQCLTKDPKKRPSATKLLSCKYLQSRGGVVPSDFKIMIDNVVKRRVTKYINTEACGIEQLNILAPPLTKHSRIDPPKDLNCTSEGTTGTFWDFGDNTRKSSNTDLASSKSTSSPDGGCEPQIPLPNIPPRKRPVQQLQQQLQQQQLQYQHQHQHRQHQHQHQHQHQQYQQQYQQLHHQLDRQPTLTPQISQAWIDQTFASVEARVSIPKCIARIQRLHQEFDEINRLYPGFTHAFVQEVRRALR